MTQDIESLDRKLRTALQRMSERLAKDIDEHDDDHIIVDIGRRNRQLIGYTHAIHHIGPYHIKKMPFNWLSLNGVECGLIDEGVESEPIKIVVYRTAKGDGVRDAKERFVKRGSFFRWRPIHNSWQYIPLHWMSAREKSWLINMLNLYQSSSARAT